MKTSGSQLDRLLDPRGANVTIETLQRAATVLVRPLRVELVSGKLFLAAPTDRGVQESLLEAGRRSRITRPALAARRPY